MKRIIVLIICIILIIFIGGVGLYLLGKPLKVKTDKEVNGLSNELSDILYYASLAPNSHNTQMWRIHMNTKDEVIKIFLDEERTLKVVDSKNREAYISIGAYTTNLLTAFNAYGYDTNCVINNQLNSKEIVTIHYHKRTSNQRSYDKNIVNSILKRHTDKNSFLKRLIDGDTINALLDNDNQLYYYKDRTKEFTYIKDSTVKATKQQAYNAKKAEEFAKWLRLSDKETFENKDGISAEQLGISGVKKTLYYWTTTHDSAKGKTFAKQTIDTAKKQVNHCAGFLILTGGESREELIETGMKLERVWLRAVDLGISVQPMSQILEEVPYSNEVNKNLGINETIQMIIRLGYVKDYGENSQIRRDLSEYITVEQ